MNIFTEFTIIMDKGGPLMWVIFSAASIAFILLCWQTMRVYLNYKSASMDYMRLQLNSHSKESISECVSHKGPVSYLVDQLGPNDTFSKDDLLKALNIHLGTLSSRLEGSLPTVAIIGTLLPMMGLLGTVTGMINVFEVIAIHGSGKPEAMAEGISQALLTTASGLIFAIPVIFLHHLLKRKVNKLKVIVSQSAQIILHSDYKLFADL